MKSIKLIIVFVIILGGIVGIMLIPSNNEDVTLLSPPEHKVEKFNRETEELWNKVDDWDENLYKTRHQSAQRDNKEYDVTSLTTVNTNKAIDIVEKKIEEQWSLADCKKSTIDKYIEAINTIKQVDKSAEKTRPIINDILRINRIYTIAYEYSTKLNFNLEPSVKHKKVKTYDFAYGYTPEIYLVSWDSSKFSKHRQGIKECKAFIISNEDYQTYLSNIENIKERLNSTDSELEEVRNNYYTKLGGIILEAYNKQRKNAIDAYGIAYEEVNNKYYEYYNEGLYIKADEYRKAENELKKQREEVLEYIQDEYMRIRGIFRNEIKEAGINPENFKAYKDMQYI